MNGIPTRAQVFIALILVSGACLGGLAVSGMLALAEAGKLSPLQWAEIGCLITGVAVLARLRVPMPTGSGYMALGTIGYLGILVALPLPLAVCGCACGMLVAQVTGHRPLIKMAFNVAMIVIAVTVAGTLLSLLGGADVLFSPQTAGPRTVAAILVACGAYYGTHYPLFTIFQSLLSGRSLAYTFRVNHRGAIVTEALAMVVGVMGGLLWRFYPPLTLLTIAPTILTYLSHQNIRRLQSETVRAVTELANSIDVRDHYTAQHSVRVAANSRRVAVALGLDPDKIDEIFLAGSVHDIGKMTVPVEILDKPGALSPAERQIIEQHPVTGAEVLKHYKGFGAAIPIVLHHHERWDGHGYPAGLAGTQIPLGARIMALADTFDAMTSDRPYRRGMDPSEALRRIAAAAGTQFDPDLATVFVELLAADYPAPEPETTDHIVVFPTVARAVPHDRVATRAERP